MHDAQTSEQVQVERYGELPYLSLPHPPSDPNVLELVGRLHGLDPVPHHRARVLELGAGDGGNLLAIAAAWPQAHCVGVDISADAVCRGTKMVADAGLDNVELHVGDVTGWRPESEFDYVLIHGFVAWVPEPVRVAALRLAGEVLSPNGLVVCDYNALPGWYRWTAAQQLMQAGARGHEDPAAAMVAARQALAMAVELNGNTAVHAQTLSEALHHANARSDYAIYHDDLNPFCTPLYLADIVELGHQHGLAYVGEALPEQWWEIVAEPAERVRSVAGGDPVEQQRVADLVTGAYFKATVLGRPAATRGRTGLDHARAIDMVVVPVPTFDGDIPEQMAPLERAVLEAAVAAGSRGARAGDVAAARGEDPLAGARASLSLASSGWVSARAGHPPVASRVPERPFAHPLTRAQAAVGELVFSMAHMHVRAEDEGVRRLIRMLDGEHTVAEIARAMGIEPEHAAAVVGQLTENGLVLEPQATPS